VSYGNSIPKSLISETYDKENKSAGEYTPGKDRRWGIAFAEPGRES
jgi:hypothetical protein